MDELRKMQLMLTDLLKFFHDFCVNNSLIYYALYGTALGAARHHGFIPWDDDLDVGMPRPDYERFIRIYNQYNSNKRYLLETPDSLDPDFTYSFSKLYDSKTTLIENYRHPLKRGIYLDVFPIDGVGKTRNESAGLINKITFLLFLRNMRTVKIVKRRSLLKNAVLAFFQMLPDCLLNEKRLSLKVDSLCKSYQYDSSEYVVNLFSSGNKREIVHKTVLGVPVLYPFENIQINCPEKMDVYLSHLYGDWRTPPPEEKRLTHHSYYLDLSKPF